MPAQVADWSEVKATAIATGSLTEAAELHQVSYDAVKMRASREQWPVGRRVHKLAQQAQEAANTQIIRASKGAVTSVTSAADAIAATLAEGAKQTKLGLTAYTARMAQQAATQGLLEEAPLYKAVADIHGKMHPETTGDSGVTLQFFAITGQQEPVERPVIDVEQA